MKSSNKLPRNLRVFFTLLRILTVSLAVFWIGNLTVTTWFVKRSAEHSPLFVTLGEIGITTPSNAVQLNANDAPAGSLGVTALRGTLQMNALSENPALLAALRWTMIPSMAVFGMFAWFLFGALRQLCANLERGETFSENNGGLVRKIGITLICFSLAGFVAELWGAHVMGGYLGSHVTLSGALVTGASPSSAAIAGFHVNAGQFPSFSGIVVGCLVLLISAAFTQGLKLKAENDLTV